MAALNLGNVVGILKGSTPPAKQYILWARDISPGVTVNYYYDYGLAAWAPLVNGNPYYQKPVLEVGRNAPPASPTSGDRYVIGAAPTGAWAGFAQYIAAWNGASYDLTPPLTTMQVQSLGDLNKLFLFDGTVWDEFAAGDGADLVAFNGARPITRNIAGLLGVTPGGTDLKQFNENLYYPPAPPAAAIAIQGGNIREFGSDGNVVLAWTATKGQNNITAISVNGNPISPVLGTTQNGTTAAVGSTSADTAFPMVVTAGAQTANATVSLLIRHKRFWFVSDQDLMAMSAAAISTLLNEMEDGFEWATDRNQPARTMTPASQYYYFIYLNTYGLASFVVNNGPNTDQQTKTFNYVNSKGYSAVFRLYRSTNLLNNTFTVDIN